MPEWYANPDPRYQPAMRLISSITQANPVVIETSFAHDYVTGLIIRINVPAYYGMRQIDKHVGKITVLSPTTFSMDLDTSKYDPFAVPASPPYYNQTATCVPVGNVLNVYDVAVRNVS